MNRHIRRRVFDYSYDLIVPLVFDPQRFADRVGCAEEFSRHCFGQYKSIWLVKAGSVAFYKGQLKHGKETGIDKNTAFESGLIIQGKSVLGPSHAANIDDAGDGAPDGIRHGPGYGGIGFDMPGIIEVHADRIDLVVLGVPVVEFQLVGHP